MQHAEGDTCTAHFQNSSFQKCTQVHKLYLHLFAPDPLTESEPSGSGLGKSSLKWLQFLPARYSASYNLAEK